MNHTSSLLNIVTSNFVTHEAFHTSAVSKTTTKDITGSGLTEVSTKLSGYVWVGSKTKLVHIPGGQADDVFMLDVETQDEEEVDEETKDLPSLEVKIEEVEEDEPQQAQDDQQDDACSRQREVASEFPGYSSQLERPEFPKARGPTERYGNFIMSQRTLFKSFARFVSGVLILQQLIQKNIVKIMTYLCQ